MNRAVHTINHEQNHGEIKSGKIDSYTTALCIIQNMRVLKVRITSLNLAENRQVMVYTSTTQHHEFCPPNVWCGVLQNEICEECTSFTRFANTYDVGSAQYTPPLLPTEIVSEEGDFRIVIRSGKQAPWGTFYQYHSNVFVLEWNTTDTVALPVELHTVQTCDINQRIATTSVSGMGGQNCEGWGSDYCSDASTNICKSCQCHCGAKFCTGLYPSRRLLQVEGTPVGQTYEPMMEEAPLNLQRRLLQVGNTPHMPVTLPVLESSLRQQIGAFLNIDIAHISQLQYLHTSDPLYRRASFTMILDTLPKQELVRSVSFVNNFISAMNVASNDTAIVRNIATVSTPILVCPGGSYWESNKCLECPANSFSPMYSTSITACSCNTGWVGADGDVCVQCGAGKYKSSAIGTPSFCQMCPVGKFKTF